MDELQQSLQALALNESSFSHLDPEYEFDACQFFDFCVEETDQGVEEAERWFRYARQYPPAPYMVKIKLTNTISRSIPEEVCTTSSPKLEADGHVSAHITTSSDGGTPSLEEKTEAGSGQKCHNLFADDDTVKTKSKSTNRSKSSRTFMKPTASHLAKQINMIDVHADSRGRSHKLQTPTGCETEDTKRQKLEAGFSRKVAQLTHRTSFSHKTTPKAEQLETSSNSRSKTTIPRKPKLMTEERARWRSFRSQSKTEENIHTFKAIPLNRKILESPDSLAMTKKSMPDQYSPEFQKFHFKTTAWPMQYQSA